MGGDPYGGGNSPSLALLCLTVLVTLWIASGGSEPKRAHYMAIFSGLASLMLSEVKVIFIAAPFCILAALICSKSGAKKLTQVFLLFPLAAMGVFSFYTYQIYSGSGQNLNVAEQFDKQQKEIFEPNLFVDTTGEVGRVTAIRIWVQDSRNDPWRMFLGYGSGALAADTGAGAAYSPTGKISRIYTHRIGPSALVRLLWEQGLIFVCLMFSALFLFLLKLVVWTRASNAPVQPNMIFAGCVLAAAPIFLSQSNAALDTVQMPFLFAFAVAVVVIVPKIPSYSNA